MDESTHLSFDGGTIVIRKARVPHSVWDERVQAFRAPALYYGELLEYLKHSGEGYVDNVTNYIPCPTLTCQINLRPYQKEALKQWERAGRKGVVVLPTGAGKTELAMKAIELVNESTIIVAPTIDLLEQWRTRLTNAFHVDVGEQGGGTNEMGAITVSTYDTAHLKAAVLGNRFKFVVFDEVHHLAATTFRQIAEMFTAPYRLGLTATLEREDMLHLEISRLVGNVVYRLGVKHLAGKFLAEYSLERVSVELDPLEREEYDANYAVYRRYVAKHKIRLKTSGDFLKLVLRSGGDPEARRALLARNRAMNIAFSSNSKIHALARILERSPDERILIFTQHNDMVYKISLRFLLPFITHTTSKDERAEVLSRFKSGEYRAIVTSKVLDEGIDVPEASLGIIVSGTGSNREFVQRLGRLLRKSNDKPQAKLVEIVSQDTSEIATSVRRKHAVGA